MSTTTPEEQDIINLPKDRRILMAQLVLAGCRFERGDYALGWIMRGADGVIFAKPSLRLLMGALKHHVLTGNLCEGVYRSGDFGN